LPALAGLDATEHVLQGRWLAVLPVVLEALQQGLGIAVLGGGRVVAGPG
jgi:hypothetical protein